MTFQYTTFRRDFYKVEFGVLIMKFASIAVFRTLTIMSRQDVGISYFSGFAFLDQLSHNGRIYTRHSSAFSLKFLCFAPVATYKMGPKLVHSLSAVAFGSVFQTVLLTQSHTAQERFQRNVRHLNYTVPWTNSLHCLPSFSSIKHGFDNPCGSLYRVRH